MSRTSIFLSVLLRLSGFRDLSRCQRRANEPENRGTSIRGENESQKSRREMYAEEISISCDSVLLSRCFEVTQPVVASMAIDVFLKRKKKLGESH